LSTDCGAARTYPNHCNELDDQQDQHQHEGANATQLQHMDTTTTAAAAAAAVLRQEIRHNQYNSLNCRCLRELQLKQDWINSICMGGGPLGYAQLAALSLLGASLLQHAGTAPAKPAATPAALLLTDCCYSY
jgi:hypothetical protein